MKSAWLVECWIDDGIKHSVTIVIVAVGLSEIESAASAYFDPDPDDTWPTLLRVESVKRVSDVVVSPEGKAM